MPAEAEAKADEADKPGWLRGLFTTTADRTAPKVEMDPEERRRAAIVDGFMSPLRIEPVENTQLVKVSYESPDRELVARVTNTYAQVFIQQHLDAQLQSTREAGDWLSSRLGDLKANLQRSEQALQDFRDSEQLVDVTGVETLAVQELNALNAKLVDARSKRAEAENIFRAVAGSASRTTEDLMRTPAVLQHSMVSELAAAEASRQAGGGEPGQALRAGTPHHDRGHRQPPDHQTAAAGNGAENCRGHREGIPDHPAE